MASNLGTVFVELSLDDKVYKQKLSDIQPHAVATAKGVETAWKALGTKSAEVFDAQRRAAENAYTLIKNAATTTSNDIVRAEQAKTAKIKQLNEQQYGHQTTMLEGLKKNWIAASVAIGAAMVAASKAMAYMEEGAKALQIESSFKIMSDAAGVHSEKLIASMKAATKETIDDSDMMQKAIKLMTLGYNPEQIERFSRVVITASQIAGTTAAEAYDGLADAIANRMPKALVRMGAVTKEQMKIVNKAIEEGADSTKLYELAMANLEMKQLMLQGTQDGATIAMQRFHAQIKETKEELGKGLIILVEKLYGVLQAVAAASLAASGGLFTLVSHLPGTDKAKWQGEAKAAFGAGESLAFKSNDNLFGATTKESKASSDALKAAQDRINALMKEMNAIIGKGDASKKAASEQEAATKKILEATRKAAYELESVGQSQYDKDMARIKSEAEQYRKLGVDRITIAKYVATETALADGKNTERMFQKWNTEADKAISAMQTEIDAGVKLTEDKIRDRQKYNEFAKEQADLLLSVEDHAIEDLIDKERKKYDYLEKLELDGVITHTEAEEAKRKATEERIKSEKEIESEKWMKANAEQQQVFSNLATCFDTASQLYAEDSKERQALSEAAKIATMAEIALQVQKNLMIAVGAVLTQGTGDPYSAFARIAAMIAVVTGILSIVGIAFSGSSSAGAAATPHTGETNVLGGSYQQESKSLENSLGLVEDSLDNMFNLQDTKLTKIYNELKDLNGNITGLVARIFQSGTMTSDYTGTVGSSYNPDMFGVSESNTGVGFFDNAVNWVQGKLFGDVTKSIAAVGIKTSDTSIKSLLNDITYSALNAAKYTIVKTEEDGGWFHSDHTSYQTITSTLDSRVNFLLNKAFQNMSSTLMMLTEELGTSVSDTMNYVFKGVELNLQNMSGEEATAAINEYFSKVGDEAVQTLFGSILREYQKINEGLLETAVRLVTDKETVMNILSATGHAIEEVVSGSGRNIESIIALSEELITLSGGLDKLTENAESYYTAFYSEAEQMSMARTQLRGSFVELGYVMPKTRDAFRDLAESLDLTTKSGKEAYAALMAMAEYADKYYSYLEELIKKQASLNIDLLKLQGDAAGALAKERAIEIAETNTYLQTLQKLVYAQEDLNDLMVEATDLLKKWHSMESQLLELQGDKVGALAAQRESELDALDESLRPLQELLYAQEDLNNARATEITAVNNLITAQGQVVSELQGYVDKLKSARESMKMEGTKFVADQATSARFAFNAVLEQARLGDLSGIGSVDKAMSDLVANANSPNSFRTKQEYEENYYKTYNDIAELEKLAGTQLSTEEQTLNTLKDQLKVLNQIAGNTDNSDLSVQDARDAVNLAHAEVMAKQAASEQARAQYEATRQAFVTMEEVVNSINSNNEQLTMSIAEMTAALLSARQAVINLTTAWSAEQAAKTVEQAATEQADAATIAENQAAAEQASAQKAAYLQQNEASAYFTPVKAGSGLFSVDSGKNRLTKDAMLETLYGLPEGKGVAQLERIVEATNENDIWAQYGFYYLDQNKMLQRFDMGGFHYDIGQEEWPDKIITTPSGRQLGPSDVGYQTYRGTPYTIMAFAEGGTFGGGYRLVGETGPEIEYTGPSQIISNAKSKALIDNSEVVRELKSLREDIKAYGYAIAKNTGKSAKVSDRWDIDGLPAERTIT